MAIRSGQDVDRYTVDGLVGAGGMARVYRVRHARLGSQHALKVLRLPTPAVIDRLLREGRAQSSLRHPNIVSVTDVIDVEGAPGLVMEWVEGPNLDQLLGAARLDPSEVNHLAEGLFAGIRAAHDAGWVHRDLKPANILVQPLSGQLLPRITDFGLVKALEGDVDDIAHRTRTGAVMGTPAYMAPEQLLDSGTVDHRADVWALGVILYELCANVRPFDASDPSSVVRAHRQPLPSLQSRPDLPDAAMQAIQWALRTDRNERAPTVAALAEKWAEGDWPSDPPGPGTLELARSLAPVVRPEQRADSATLSMGSELFGRSTRERPREEPTTAPTAEVSTITPARWPVAGLGVGGVGVVLALGVLLWPRPDPPEVAAVEVVQTVLTPTSTPVVTADATAQEQFELGWQSFLQGDRTEALRRLETASAGSPDAPLPELLRSYVLLRDKQVGASLSMSRQAVRTWPDSKAPGGELLSVVAAQQKAGSVDVPAVGAYGERYPDDLLALLMRADYCGMIDAETCEREVPALVAAAPRAPLAWQVAAESWMELGDPDRAREAIASGLAVSPHDPTLLDLRVRDELQREDYASARKTLQRLQEVDPGAESPRTLRVRLAVLEDDEDTLTALRAELTSPSQPLTRRYAFYEVAADTLLGLGRAREAAALQADVRKLAEAEGNPLDQYMLHIDARTTAFARGDMDGVIHHLEQAAAVATNNPEVGSVHRDKLTGYLLWARGVQFLAAGDIDAAAVNLDRMKKGDGIAPDSIETLARSIAVARKDPQAVAKLGRTLWNGECSRGTTLGDAILRAGDAERARPLLQKATESGCRRYTSQRAVEVLARVALAEALVELGEKGQARLVLTRVAGLWPDADVDHPVARRWRDVQKAVDG